METKKSLCFHLYPMNTFFQKKAHNKETLLKYSLLILSLTK